MYDDESSTVSRRRFLAGATGAGIALGLDPAAPGEAASRSDGGPDRVEVAVVGAGLAGLTAAHRLRAAGRSVLVLEARRRVGGRCFSRPIGGGHVLNMGATFVGPTQRRALRALRSLGIAHEPVYAHGDLLLASGGTLTRYTGTVPPVRDAAAEQELLEALVTVDRLARTVPLAAPWRAPEARALDSLTVSTWATSHLARPEARALFALVVEAVLSTEMRDISWLYFLAYVHAAGGVTPLIANAGSGGAQDFHVTGGTQSIAVGLARELGDRVRLGRPVRAIEWNRRGATVLSDGGRVRARRVIVAVAPHLAARIAYGPALTARREQLTQRMPIGSLVKVNAVYDRPFWRAEGLNGQVNSDTGPVKVTFDLTPRSGRPGVLMGFIDGDDARAISDLPARDRRRSALASLARYFGARAAHPRLFVDQVWAHEPWTGGCPVGVMAPGVMTEYGPALRAPVGPLHWAGTETATEWTGYMDGAIESGERAAREALDAL